MAVIQISINVQADKGKNELAKNFNLAFEGDFGDMDFVEKEVSKLIEEILKNKKVKQAV